MEEEKTSVFEMNVYEKLQQCRIELQEMNLKKSGWNDYSKYDYYELQDFLPAINNLFHKLRLCNIVTFTSDFATLTIYNMDKPEESIVFTSPMSTAKLTACHEVQNLGAVESYERRYLYMTALEIVEVDVLDKTHNNKQQPKTSPKTAQKGNRPTTEKLTELYNLAKKKGVFLKEYGSKITGKNSSAEWTVQDYDAVKNNLEKMEDKV